MKDFVSKPTSWFSLLILSVVVALVPCMAQAQNHFDYYLYPDSPLLDIQGPPVSNHGSSSAPGGGYFSGNTTIISDNTLMYIDLNAVFQTTTNLLIGDIVGFTYYTIKGSETAATNWAARIYTAPVPNSSWYQYRFDGAQHIAPTMDWTLLDGNDPGYFYNLNDRSDGGNTNEEFSYGWSDIVGTPKYASAELLYFAFLLPGSSDNTNGIALIEFTLANGDTATLYLIPEPEQVAGCLLSLLFIAIFSRRYLRSRRRF
jgi:hypothetical protein